MSTKKEAHTAWIEPPTKNRNITNIMKLVEKEVEKDAKICNADIVMIIVLRPKLSEINPITIIVIAT